MWGRKRIHKSFDLSKIRENSIKNLEKILANMGKIGAQPCLTWKSGAQYLQKNTWRPFFGGHIQKSLHDLYGIIFVGKSRTKTFRASLGKNFPQNLPAPTPLHKRGILSCFSDQWPNRSHLRGVPKTKMAPRAPRSLNPSLNNRLLVICYTAVSFGNYHASRISVLIVI